MIINANALDVDLDILEACDVQVVDPPFSAHVHDNVMSSHSAGSGPGARLLGFGPITPELMGFISLTASVVKRWSVVFCDVESTHLWRDAMASNDVEYVRELPCVLATADGELIDGVENIPTRWIRWSQPQISGDRPPTGSEAVLHFHAMAPRGPRGGAPKPLAKHWNGHGGMIAYDSRALRGADKHPTEKPLDLMLTIVSAFSDPGETVIDLCCGRGTTVLACKLLGRNGIGVEADRVWAAEAEVREESALFSRDKERVERWIEQVAAEIGRVPEPKSKIDIPTWERAQRRLQDMNHVRKVTGL